MEDPDGTTHHNLLEKRDLFASREENLGGDGVEDWGKGTLTTERRDGKWQFLGEGEGSRNRDDDSRDGKVGDRELMMI